jgi:hypothetical protein
MSQNGRIAQTIDGETVEVGKFRKVNGGWQGYVRGSDGYPVLITIPDGPEWRDKPSLSLQRLESWNRKADVPKRSCDPDDENDQAN